MNSTQFDFVVIGSGLAGSAAAHLLSDIGSVALVAKAPPTASNSHAAQGGIAAAFSQMDSPELHLKDTLGAGDGLCHTDAVATLVNRAPALMRWLMSLGVQFDCESNGQISLGLEGAHSHPRILHAGGDATGASLLRALTETVRHDEHITRYVHEYVAGLLHVDNTVHGAYVRSDDGSAQFLTARRGVVLATGGLGQLFLRTTNPLGARGEGIALAYQAGAQVRNLSFIQFHPTALDIDTNPRFLISEAVRGAGAHLVNQDGYRVMNEHPLGDLAPRDVVARAIYTAEQSGATIYLDARHVSNFRAHFPTIYENCCAQGWDPTISLLPVSPAAHFAMGGVVATISGETSVHGLYAIGEVACTGVHGANRLASNSLLECLVMAHELAEHFQQNTITLPPFRGDYADIVRASFIPEDETLRHQIQQILWKHAGIVRDRDGIMNGLEMVSSLQRAHPRSALVITARLMLESALWREESRGAHFRADFPVKSNQFACDDTSSLNSQTGGHMDVSSYIGTNSSWSTDRIYAHK